MTETRSRIARRVESLPPSGIRRFFELVEQMPEAISLGIGEPDFVTPWRIRESAIYSLERGHTHYTPNRGIQELREKLASYLERRFGVLYDPDEELLITIGASEAIDVALRAVLEPEDGVLVPQPCFVSYAPCAVLAGGRTIAVPTSVQHEFRVQVTDLDRANDGEARALLISYPNNPTGAILSRADMESLVGYAQEHDLLVISDEIYAELTYDGPHVSAAAVPGGKERTILIGGFSKAWAMTGWRLGFAAADAEIIEAMAKVHSYTVMCPPTVAQEAAVEALEGCDEEVARMHREYNQRRRVVVKRLNAMGLECFEPRGAFYAFPAIAGAGMTCEQFAERLLQEEKVAVVPGTAFGACGEGFVRCSYATSMPLLEEALGRMASFVERVRG
ncbi:MAG: aminotransferase class I/II-fold pyridoxal phosphate-dependent enzyme [Armatimonadota bacterium]|nr:MAG: aminotransferase class I/II-fold pyridoxal phosphate-dependent enzyme [Armatimonadota bacterium]